MPHVGDLIVSDTQETTGQFTRTTYVRSGGLIARGQPGGGLIIEAGGQAIVHAQVARNVVNHGTLSCLVRWLERSLAIRLYTVDIGKSHIPWATQVVHLKISGLIRPTMVYLHNMAARPGCVFVTDISCRLCTGWSTHL